MKVRHLQPESSWHEEPEWSPWLSAVQTPELDQGEVGHTQTGIQPREGNKETKQKGKKRTKDGHEKTKSKKEMKEKTTTFVRS